MSINTAELNQLVDKALEGIDKAEAVMRDLYSQLEDAQGEIRALRATEAGLRERVKELENVLKSCYATLRILGDSSDKDVSPAAWHKSGAEASEIAALNLILKNNCALLEKQQ